MLLALSMLYEIRIILAGNKWASMPVSQFFVN